MSTKFKDVVLISIAIFGGALGIVTLIVMVTKCIIGNA